MSAHTKFKLHIQCPIIKGAHVTILASDASSTSKSYLNALTTKMIRHSQKNLQQFIVPKSHATLKLTKMNIRMTPPLGLPLFSNQHSF